MQYIKKIILTTFYAKHANTSINAAVCVSAIDLV